MVSAIVGVAGLEATYEAVKAGKTVGVANKECLVAAGLVDHGEARNQGSRCCRSTASITPCTNACGAGEWKRWSESG